MPDVPTTASLRGVGEMIHMPFTSITGILALLSARATENSRIIGLVK